MAVQLASVSNLYVMQGELRASIQQRLQSLGAEKCEELRPVMDFVSARLSEILQHCTVIQPVTSPAQAVPPEKFAEEAETPCFLSATPADDELTELHQQVRELSAKVQELRQTVPQSLTESLLAQLEECRLTVAAAGITTDAGGVCGDQAAAEDPDQLTGHQQSLVLNLSPPANKLQHKFAEVIARMPALRARLEEALNRLERVVAAVEAENLRAQPPGTVERAALGLLTARKEGSFAAASPAQLQQTPGSDAAVLRRRLAQDLRPIPCLLAA